MKMTDASTIVNELYQEVTGKKDIAEVDNTNIVDIGKTLQTLGTGTDVIFRKLGDKVGKVMVLNRLYKGKFPAIVRDAYSFGNILQMLKIKPMSAVADPSYNPVNGQDYSLTTYEALDVSQYFFTDYDSYQVKYWRPTEQLWSAFNSLEEMTRFLSGIEIEAANAMTIRVQSLAKNCIANYIASVLYEASPTGEYGTTSTNQAKNVLKLYKAEHPDSTLTAETCHNDPDFWRFFVRTLKIDHGRMEDMSSLFNIYGEDTFTPAEDIKLVMLNTVENDAATSMYYSAYNKEDVLFPEHESVPFWQASGTGYDRGVISEVNMKIKGRDGNEHQVEASGILACMFDKDAVCVTNEHKKSTAFYHPDLDQTLTMNKYYAQYLNNFAVNFIVYYVADEA